MREFILLALKARTSPDFSLTELVKAGRLNTVCRTISNSLCISNSIRKDTIIHVALSGPTHPPKLISFDGSKLKGLAAEDEQEIAKIIKVALKKGLNLKLNEEIVVSEGIKISKKAFETLLKEKFEDGFQLIYLHQNGEDVRKLYFKEKVLFILGDFIGLPRKTEKLLERFNAEKIQVGPKIVFASHCPVIVHNELDRREAGW